jgi:hypothetical protein
MKALQPGTRVMVIDNTKMSKWNAKYEGPFEVVEQTHGGAYVLKDVTGEILPHKRTIDMLKVIELPVEEKKISPMAMPSGGEGDDKKKKVRRSERVKKEEKKEIHLEVERILNHRKKGRIIEYLVKWKNYGEEENQWRKVEDFDDL